MLSKCWCIATGLILSQCVGVGQAACDTYNPIYPLPELEPDNHHIRHARDVIKRALNKTFATVGSNRTSYSIEVTSRKESLFSFHHTATWRDEQRPGAELVDGSTRYRIASNTKAFTVLALLQQEKEGRLKLDDPVNVYLPELDEKQTGSLPWKDITIRTLASQLSGIPRDMGVGELSVEANPLKFGFPPVSREGLEICDALIAGSTPCTKQNLIDYLRTLEPVFAPKQKSTYSNLNFDILGLVIEKVSGMPYSDYIQEHILKPLEMNHTSFVTPPDSTGALVKNFTWGWDQQMDVQRPTGGLYSSTDDMVKWARHVLARYNGLTPSLNWFNPASFSLGLTNFYGTPWEIFRTSAILKNSQRPVTFITKGGGWPGYTSHFVVVPEYGFGFIVMVAAPEGKFSLKASSIVSRAMVVAADMIAQDQVAHRHTGEYTVATSVPAATTGEAGLTHLNSSITISHSEQKGLYISSWISNSTDVIESRRHLAWGMPDPSKPFYLQLVPTLLYKDEEKQEGEIWRISTISITSPEEAERERNEYDGLFEDLCGTDVDGGVYGGKPLTEVVFWSTPESHEQGTRGKKGNGEKPYAEIELSAFRVRLQRSQSKSNWASTALDAGQTLLKLAHLI